MPLCRTYGYNMHGEQVVDSAPEYHEIEGANDGIILMRNPVCEQKPSNQGNPRQIDKWQTPTETLRCLRMSHDAGGSGGLRS